MVSLIAAVCESNYVIGNDLDIPWHISEDFKAFKELTIEHPIIMGRRTMESFGGRLLPKRHHVVVSSTYSDARDRVEVTDSLEVAMESYSDAFVIGGSGIYAEALESPHLTDMYISWVKGEYEGNVFFPQFDKSQWNESNRT